MMLRRAFLKRMAFAALATGFLDLPLPEALAFDPPSGPVTVTHAWLSGDGLVDAFVRGSLTLHTEMPTPEMFA